MPFRVQTDNERSNFVRSREQNNKGPAYILPGTFREFNPKVGTNTIRILPTAQQETQPGFPGLELWRYFFNGRYYPSPKTMGAHAIDPVQNKYSIMKREGDENAKTFRGSKRMVIFLLDLTEDENSTEVLVWSAPDNLITEILTASKLRKGAQGELRDFTHPEKGCAISFDRQGTNASTRYVAPRLEEDYVVEEKISEQLREFKDFIDVPTPEEMGEIIASVLSGGVAAPSEPRSPRVRHESVVSQVEEPEDAPASRPRSGFRRTDAENDDETGEDPLVAAERLRAAARRRNPDGTQG